MMKEEEFRELLTKYTEGAASEQEIAMLESRYFRWNETEKPAHSEEMLEEADGILWARVNETLKFNEERSNSVQKLWYRIVAAAVILIVVGVGLYFINDFKSVETKSIYANDVKPGSNRATIQLANGKIINLSGGKAGIVIDASKLAYNDGTRVTEQQPEGGEMLTMQTPKGGQYEATLPDGTHIWLNAASTLKFPSQFSGNERLVELSGEAYFEVAHNKTMPFKVVSRGQQVEVLGTHFNIEAYANERSIRTTLLEGSVRIDDATVLKPDQQAVLFNGGIRVLKVDAEDAVAWKNGFFTFDDEPLFSIMNKLKRWYDVEVVYDVGVDVNELYGGSVSRYGQISSVLKTLESTRVIHFKIDGRRVTVMK